LSILGVPLESTSGAGTCSCGCRSSASGSTCSGRTLDLEVEALDISLHVEEDLFGLITGLEHDLVVLLSGISHGPLLGVIIDGTVGIGSFHLVLGLEPFLGGRW